MIAATLLYFGFIVILTGGGVFLTKVGTTSGHLVASAVGAFGCVLVAAAATLTLGMSGVVGSL